MSLISLDAAPLIYLSKADSADPADADDRLRGRKVRRLLESADQEGDVVTIPSVALAEYLAGDRLPDSVFEQVDIETASVYVVLELSAEAAKIAAKIWRKGVKPLAQPAGGRQSLKADIYICASAIAHKVSKIITNDPHFIELLKGSEVEVVIVDKLPMDLVDALTGKD